MKAFASGKDFDREMNKIKKIMDEKGFILESDHILAYSMQYDEVKDDVIEWLYDHGYNGDLRVEGAYHEGAVYGLYDSTRITLEDMREELKKEAERQR